MHRRRRGAATVAEGKEGQHRNNSGKLYEPLIFLTPRYLFISLHRLISASSASLAVFRGDWDRMFRQTWPIFPVSIIVTIISRSLILIYLPRDEEGVRGDAPAETRSGNGGGGRGGATAERQRKMVRTFKFFNTTLPLHQPPPPLPLLVCADAFPRAPSSSLGR